MFTNRNSIRYLRTIAGFAFAAALAACSGGGGALPAGAGDIALSQNGAHGHKHPSPSPSATPAASASATPAASASATPAASATAPPSTPAPSPSPLVALASTPAPTATPIAVSYPATISRRHVDTADYWLDTTSQAQYAPYLTYEYPHSAYAAAVKAAGIKAVAYENMGMPRISSTLPESNLATGTYLSAMARNSSGGLVLTGGGTQYLLNVHASNASQFLQAVVDAHYKQWVPDAVFFDNWNDLYSSSSVPSSFSTYADWTSASTSAISAINMHGARLFLNTLSIKDSYGTPPAGVSISNSVAGLNASAVTGGEYEDCYANYAKAWVDAEAAELQTIAANRTFWCYANGSLTNLAADSGAALTKRMFVYASFLLTYNPNLSIYQTWLQTASHFKVMPETQFVPTAPAYAISSISNALYAGGAYARSYKACYYAGKLVGACEIIVNPSDTTTVTSIPNRSQYTASAVLQGSDILDGGTVTFHGAVPASLPPLSAAILLK